MLLFPQTDADLLHAQQVDQARVLPGLALDLARLVVSFGDRRREIASCEREEEGR